MIVSTADFKRLLKRWAKRAEEILREWSMVLPPEVPFE